MSLMSFNRALSANPERLDTKDAWDTSWLLGPFLRGLMQTQSPWVHSLGRYLLGVICCVLGDACMC